LPYKHKVVISGNHELSFDDNILQQSSVMDSEFDPNAVRKYLHRNHLTKMKDILVNCTYLEDSETTVFGLKVFGSPWYDDVHLLVWLLAVCYYRLEEPILRSLLGHRSVHWL